MAVGLRHTPFLSDLQACAFQISLLLTAISAWTKYFWFFLFFHVLVQGDGKSTQWGRTMTGHKNFRVNRKLTQSSQPAGQLVCWPWPWSSSPHPLEWAVPHLRWSMKWHFQVGFCCHLNDQQESYRRGSQRHTDKKWWIRNILYSHKVFVACVLFAHFSTHAITLQMELFVQRGRAKLNTSSDIF